MEPIKKLIIYTKNPNNIEIVESVAASMASILLGTVTAQPTDSFHKSGLFSDGKYIKAFNIYPPKVYSFKTPELAEEYFKAVLQENHDYKFETKQLIGGSYQGNLTIDGIEFHVHDNGLIVSLESGLSEALSDSLPRNNLKLYQMFLPFLEAEKKRLTVLEALTKRGYGKNYIDIYEAKFNDERGFKVECYGSYEEKEINNFEAFFYFKTNKFQFFNLLHPEGEYYRSGNEPYKLSEIELKIERLQKLAVKYKELELEINSIEL